MSIKVEKREFLNKDPNYLESVFYSVDVTEGIWPDMHLKISDGSDSLYFDVSGMDRKSLNESLGTVVSLHKALGEFIDLVKENQTEILKAYAAKS